MGLLNKSNTLQKSHEKNGDSFKDIEIPQEKINVIRDRIDNLKDGIDSPFYIFRILHENLDFNKGIFLLFTKQYDSFISAARNNINNYSLKSLELPRKKYIDLLENDEYKFFNTKKELKKINRFFSRSDSADIKNILIFPFFLENKIIAILLLTNTDKYSISLLNRLFKNNADNLISYRYHILNIFEKTEILNKNNSKSVLNTLDTSKIKILNLSFDPLINTVINNNSFITTSILKKDLYLLFYNFFKKSASAFIADNNSLNILIDFKNKKKIDIELIKNQADIFLNKFYKENQLKSNIREINFYS